MKTPILHNGVSTTGESLPVFLEGGEEAVLIVHGYNGHPGDYYSLAEKLNKEGFTVSLPRLPGHGTASYDFIETSHKDWLRHIIDVIYDLKARYHRIHIVGFSMGALISLYMASYGAADSIVAVVPAVILKNPLFIFIGLISIFIKKYHRVNSIKPETESRKHLYKHYWSWYYPPMLNELNKMMKLVRRRLDKINCDTLVLASEIDESVSIKGAETIINRISSGRKKLIILKKSPHLCIAGPDKEMITETICNWIKKTEADA